MIRYAIGAATSEKGHPMLHRALIFDCYTVEPAGLGVPPYLSTYVRYAYASLRASGIYGDIAYC